MDALLTALLTRSTHRVFSRPGVLEPETLLQLCLPVCILTCLRMAVRMSAQASSRLYWLPVLCSAISDFHPTNLPTLPPTHQPCSGLLGSVDSAGQPHLAVLAVCRGRVAQQPRRSFSRMLQECSHIFIHTCIYAGKIYFHVYWNLSICIYTGIIWIVILRCICARSQPLHVGWWWWCVC